MNSLGEVEAVIIPGLQMSTVSHKIVYLAMGICPQAIYRVVVSRENNNLGV